MFWALLPQSTKCWKKLLPIRSCAPVTYKQTKHHKQGAPHFLTYFKKPLHSVVWDYRQQHEILEVNNFIRESG